MLRERISDLKAWAEKPHRKPLLLLGARQVGKTWLMQEFGAQHYKNIAYIRFDLDTEIKQNFEQDLNIKRLLMVIQLHAGFPLEAGKTLIIFDEIQECPHALTSLKYFCEEAHEHHIIAAGSLLGLYEHKGTGFPVGKVDMLHLYPMSFREFLIASGHQLYADLLASHDQTLTNNFSTKLADLLKIYYFVGGMPEAVATYINTGDFNQVRYVQQTLLNGYQRDFTKHAPKEIAPRLSLIWDSIPSQLSRENKKFICKDVRPNFRMRDLELALQWLQDAGLILLVNRVAKPAMPLSAYQEQAFKAFFLDIGLLTAKTELSPRIILEGNRIFTEFKGALAEQFVQQELRTCCQLNPFYWASDNGRSEIDFLIQYDMELIPIEVKAETNLQSKSLKAYCQKHMCPTAVRTSLAGWNEQQVPLGDTGSTCRLLNLPLFAIHQLTSLL